MIQAALIFLLLANAPALPEPDPPAAIFDVAGTVSDFTVAVNSPRTLQINATSGEMLVTIQLKDGAISYGKSYTPDAAAKIFWQALGKEVICQQREATK